MYRKFLLTSAVWHESDLEFEWDADTGILRGRDADRVGEMIDSACAIGEFVSHPYPTSYTITNPRINPNEMAAILGLFWKLPDDLSAALVSGESEEDEAGCEKPLY